jgi:hypothetical protein
MPTQAEWAAAYAYLRERLRAFELIEAASEVEAAAATRVVEQYAPAYPGQFTLTELSEQSETVTRARRPDEAWTAAVTVLQTYLVEVPRLAARIGELLERDPANIVFLPDAREEEVAEGVPKFSLADLTIPPAQAEVLLSELQRLTTSGGEQLDARSDTR